MINEQEIRSASILIVDDQPSNVQLLSEMLRAVGYECIESTMDPFAVCELHRKNNYDLILLDLQMPGMDGFQVMEGCEGDRNGRLPSGTRDHRPARSQIARARRRGNRTSSPNPSIWSKCRRASITCWKCACCTKNSGNKTRSWNRPCWNARPSCAKSEARFQRLTELSSDWYWEQDEKGQFTKIFGPVFEMLGIRIGDDLGHARDDHGASWIESERNQLEENLAARKPFLDFVYSRTNPDGIRQYLMVSGEPMFDATGRFTGYRGIGKDVTETVSPA